MINVCHRWTTDLRSIGFAISRIRKISIYRIEIRRNYLLWEIVKYRANLLRMFNVYKFCGIKHAYTAFL
jgi:hypothetical protein